jgi:hypothetical protein
MEGRTVNRHALALALTLAAAGSAACASVDPTSPAQAVETTAKLTPLSPSPTLPPGARTRPVAFQWNMSELPEPEVFAMMLLGLVLIGYRVRRDSDEKFK